MTREEQIEKAWVGKYFQSNHRYDEKSFKEGAIWADANPYINWQQVRIQAAIAAMQGILANQSSVVVSDEVVIRESVSLADALVKELKGE